MFIAFAAVFLLSLVLVKVVIVNAENWGFVDIPNTRSEHSKHTPTSAGIGFYLVPAVIIPLFDFDFFLSHWLSLFAVFMVFVVGVLDDHKDTSPRTKFIVLAVSTFILYIDGIFIDEVGTYFNVPVSLGWFALPFTIFAAVGFTNALNLIDGLDGLAGSISIVILSSFFYIGVVYNDQFIMVLSGAFIASLLAFLVYNWNPASIFMGDSGSLTLGFIISLLAIKSLAYLPAVSVLFITAIPLLDTFVVMIRRKSNKKSMFSADRCHIHHLLQGFFGNETKMTVVFLVVLQTIYSLIGLQLERNIEQVIPLLLFILNVIFVYMLLNRMVQRQNRNC